MRKKHINDDGSVMNESPKKRKRLKIEHKPNDIIDGERNGLMSAERKIEGYCRAIREQTEYLAKVTNDISNAYSTYVECDDRIDSEIALHNGLANMLKLIEIQNAVKLRIKLMQINIMRVINSTCPDSDLPDALADIMREVNVSFLDSKLVRAYGEIAKVMKEDLDLSKADSKRINFAAGGLSSELEDMDSIDVLPDGVSDYVEEEISED